MGALPEQERDRFLSEYRTVAEAAAHEVWRYKDLQGFLHLWSLRAAAYSKPDFYTRMHEVRDGRGEYFTLDEVIAQREQQTQ